jgi:hypothetical protein
MKISSYKIPNSLAINKLTFEEGTSNTVSAKTPTNIIFCCDVSGSMYGSLSQMRKQLKNRIPDLISDGDTITIIWFSGRGQAGILKEEVYVNNVNDLQNLNAAIDKFLVPQGLTSFLDPIILAGESIDRMSKNRKDSVFSFIFLTDGYNNDSSWSKIIESLEKLESKISSSAFIEYGYYANSAALTEMAEKLGGEKIFSQNFESYEIEFEKKVTGKVSTRREIDIQDLRKKLMYGFMFAITQDSVIAYAVENKEKVFVPEDTKELYFFSQKGFADGEKIDHIDQSVMYASIYVLADRLKYKMVDEILSHLGDKFLLETYTSAYGKQKLNSFKETTKAMLFDPNLRFPQGQKEGFRPDPNQYCVMNLMDDLMEDENNKFFPYHPDFNYERIGAKSVTKAELSDEQLAELANAKTKAQAEKITNSIQIPEFVYPDNQADVGNSFDKLVWNETRANLSITTSLNGMVKLPKNDFGLTEVPSFIYRAYTFIKDGILNITQVPVSLTNATVQKIVSDSKGAVTFSTYEDGKLLMDFGKLPIINRKMVSAVSAKVLGKLEYDLIKVQARAKYLKELAKVHSPKENTTEGKTYSAEAAKWLQEIGVTDFNGFSPKREKLPNGDFYVAPVLETKIAGLGKLPTVDSALTAIEDQTKPNPKSPNATTKLLMDAIREVGISKDSPTTDAIRTTVKKLNKEADVKRRHLLSEIAQNKFGVILSRSWFKEFVDFDDNEIEIKVGKEDIKVKYVFEDKEIAL